MGTGDQPSSRGVRRPWGERVRVWLADRPVQQYAYAAAALLLLATGLFGGLRQVDEPERPLTPGVAVDAAPFTVTVSRASTTTDLGPLGVSKRGRFVSVVGTLRNDTDTTVTLDVIREAVSLSGVTDVFQRAFGDEVGPSETARPWGVYVVADSTSLTAVGPGLTYEVAWIYEQKATAAPPAQVVVAVVGHTLRANTVDQQQQWLDPATLATGTLPLKVVPPS